MKKQYGSFLIRCWRLSNKTYRVEIEHVQSGEKADAISLEAVQGWIESHIPGVITETEQPPAPSLTLVLPMPIAEE